MYATTTVYATTATETEVVYTGTATTICSTLTEHLNGIAQTTAAGECGVILIINGAHRESAFTAMIVGVFAVVGEVLYGIGLL